MEVCDIVQETGIKTILKKNKCKKAKLLSEEGLQTAVKSEKQRRKGKIYHLNAEFQRITRRDKKPSSVVSAKKQRETIEWERQEFSSRKLEISREDFMQRWSR